MGIRKSFDFPSGYTAYTCVSRRLHHWREGCGIQDALWKFSATTPALQIIKTVKRLPWSALGWVTADSIYHWHLLAGKLSSAELRLDFWVTLSEAGNPFEPRLTDLLHMIHLCQSVSSGSIFPSIDPTGSRVRLSLGPCLGVEVELFEGGLRECR